MTAEIARRVVKSFQEIRPEGEAVTALLRPRECEVLELLSKGASYREIAERLGIGLHLRGQPVVVGRAKTGLLVKVRRSDLTVHG